MRAWWIGVAMVVAGCGTDGATADATGTVDAAATADTSGADAGEDSGTEDVGSTDAGAEDTAEATACGGLAQATCAEGEYCRYESDCGGDDGPGVCTPKPAACDALWDPACGCDGKTYSSVCEAAATGASVAKAGTCGAEDDPCGGVLDFGCAKGLYCFYPLEAHCGWADAGGSCQPLSEPLCPPLGDPVCGCDGKTYASECVAATSGMSISGKGACPASQCGGNGALCDSGSYCELPDGTCGKDGLMGECITVPSGACPELYAPECGCDGKSYDNACFRRAAQAQKDHDGICIPKNACGKDEDCKEPSGSNCVPPDAPQVCGICFDATGPTCAADAECAKDGLVCEWDPQPCLCSPAKVCQKPCEADSCAVGEACDGGHCAPKPCLLPADCPTQFICADGLCARKPCTAAGECTGGFCVLGKCHLEPGSCELPVP